MKKNIGNRLIAIAFAFLIFISGCKKEAPVLTTDPVKNITSTTAEAGGTITFDGRSEITSVGICWDTIVNPTAAINKTAEKTANKQFTAIISGLLPNKTYFLRAYAVNAIGTGYGEQLSFTTPASVPIIKTSDVYDISNSSAVSGGVLITDGGSPVLSLGVCWDTVASPTTSGKKTSDTISTGEFTSHIYGLKPNISYHIRAYAINSLGTAYGEEKEFTTTKTPPLITTATITDKFLYSASCSVTIKSDGGSKITDYGICWSVKPDPTTSNFKTNKQYARGKFRLKDLKAGTTYYVRSYAINSEGVGYGKTKSFRTLGSPPKVRTLPSTELSTSASEVKAVVNACYLPTQTSFEYGISEKYGQTSKIKASFKGKSDTTIIAQLSDLKAGITYHYRAKASNALGTTYGKDMTLLILLEPNITGFSPIIKNYRDSVFFITPPVSNSLGQFTYSSSNPGIAVIKDNKGIITGSGTCIITAKQAPFGNFTTGSVSTTFSMNVVDVDGNVYNTVAIGDQDWMKENLKVTRFRNGTPIPNVKDNTIWVASTDAAFCLFKNDTLKLNPAFGALYNWYAAVDRRKICPVGWHVPTDAEWQIMERYLGMTEAEVEGTIERGIDQAFKLKDTTGWVKGGNGKNTSSFSALPAGFRYGTTGEFFNSGADACWWTSTQEDTYTAWLRNMYYVYNSVYRTTELKSFGFSIRCVRDKK